MEWIEAPERTEKEKERWLPDLLKVNEEMKLAFSELVKAGIKVAPEELVK